MSQVTHTPGPWTVDGEDTYAKVLSPSGWIIAETDHIHSKNPDEWEPMHLANMRLIAAAPELLAAATLGLKVAESWIHDQLDGTKFLADALAELDSVRAAITKATN